MTEVSDESKASSDVAPSESGTMPTRYAGFWIRLIASMVDDVIILSASFPLTFIALYAAYLVRHPATTFGESFTGGYIQAVHTFAMLFIGVPYYIVFHWRFGWTPGKRLFRIRVVRESDGGTLSLGRSTGRYLAHFVSALPFFAGYLMAAFSAKKQALHDSIAGTVSIFD